MGWTDDCDSWGLIIVYDDRCRLHDSYFFVAVFGIGDDVLGQGDASALMTWRAHGGWIGEIQVGKMFHIVFHIGKTGFVFAAQRKKQEL